MRVLVTGHQGYLGSVLVPMLAAAGHDVVGLDVGLYADCTIGPPPLDVKTLSVALSGSPPGPPAANGGANGGAAEISAGASAGPEAPDLALDLRDVTPEHCAGADAVVHLAALCNDPIGDLDPQVTYDINYDATVRLAKAAKDAGVQRFLFSSSCSLYGAGEDAVRGSVGASEQPLLDEDAEFAPITPYGESKVRSEAGLAELADARFCPVFLRNATAYGFSPRLRGDLVVNDLVGHALLAGEVKLRSDGMAWRPLVHAEDIAAAFLALLDAPADLVRARAYNVGQTGENYLIRDVANLVAEVVPGSRVTFAEGSGADNRNYRVTCDRIASEVPGFRPRWTLRTGIEELVEEYRRHQLQLDDLMGERHQRLARIRALQGAGRLDPQLRWKGGGWRTAAVPQRGDREGPSNEGSQSRQFGGWRSLAGGEAAPEPVDG